jgi:nucleoid DNA-binding protein
MKQSDLVKILAGAVKTNELTAKLFLLKWGETIANLLKEGKEVPLGKIGKLVVEEKKARKGRNPKTGEEIEIPPRKTVILKISQKFKEELNGG